MNLRQKYKRAKRKLEMYEKELNPTKKIFQPERLDYELHTVRCVHDLPDWVYHENLTAAQDYNERLITDGIVRELKKQGFIHYKTTYNRERDIHVVEGNVVVARKRG